MSDLDREILDKAGLSAAKVAGLLNKSRQAVSRGIAGDKDYLTPSNILNLTTALEDRNEPDRRKSLANAVTEVFSTFAERIGAAMPSTTQALDAIASAERLWLILPSFSQTYLARKESYDAIFAALNAQRLGNEDEEGLEVVVFCDRGRTDIETHFDSAWFVERQIVFLECGVVEMMFAPLIVTDPHNAKRRCFALTDAGFQPIAPDVVAAQFMAFSEHVTKKIREIATETRGRPLDVRTASTSEILEAKVDKI